MHHDDEHGGAEGIRTTIPARLDRLLWSPFHTRMVIGLGAAWIFDGLSITVASSVAGVLTEPATLDLSSAEVGLIASVYLVGGSSARSCSGGCRTSSGGASCSC